MRQPATSYRVLQVLGDELVGASPPPGAEAPLEPIDGDEAAVRLWRGEELVGKRIRGDLVLGREEVGFPLEMNLGDGMKILPAGLPPPDPIELAPFPSPITLRGCVCEGRLVLAGLALAARVHVASTRFRGQVDLRHATCGEQLAFFWCAFEESVSLSDVTLWKGVFFNRSHFARGGDFFSLLAHGGAHFSRTVFDGPCVFSRARFHASSALEPCLELDRAVCREAAFFEGAVFAGIADFSGSQFQRSAEFTEARFTEVCLVKADFRWLELRWEQIDGERILCGPTFVAEGEGLPSVLDLDALARRRQAVPLAECHRQYDLLRALFTRQGDHVSADGCFYEWKQLERRRSPLTLKPESWIVKLFHVLNWLICGYGVKPLRTILFSAAAVALFALALTVLGLSPATSPADLGAAFRELGERLAGNLEISFLAFMNFPSASRAASPLVAVLLLVERLLGWLVLLLFVTTYTRIMLR